MIRINCEQGSKEWLDLKAGMPSASNFDKIVQMNGKPSTQRKKYMYQLAGERITGVREEGYQNAAMQRGIEMEEEAVNLYELVRDVETEKVGLCYQNDEKSCLASPDRLIRGDSKGLLEVKCPMLHTQAKYLLENKLPSEYFQQVQGQLYVTGYDWCDFMSYFPGIRPFIIRVERDEKFISALDKEIKQFCKDIEDVVEKIK